MSEEQLRCWADLQRIAWSVRLLPLHVHCHEVRQVRRPSSSCPASTRPRDNRGCCTRDRAEHRRAREIYSGRAWMACARTGAIVSPRPGPRRFSAAPGRKCCGPWASSSAEARPGLRTTTTAPFTVGETGDRPCRWALPDQPVPRPRSASTPPTATRPACAPPDRVPHQIGPLVLEPRSLSGARLSGCPVHRVLVRSPPR